VHTDLSQIFDHMLQACNLCLQPVRRANGAAAKTVHVLAMIWSPLKGFSLSCISRPRECRVIAKCKVARLLSTPHCFITPSRITAIIADFVTRILSGFRCLTVTMNGTRPNIASSASAMVKVNVIRSVRERERVPSYDKNGHVVVREALLFRGTTLKYRDGGVVRQCAKGGANKIRAPAPTVPGPHPAHRPEYTNVAMDPAEVLRQAGVSVSEEFDLGPALPFTMGTAGSDSEFHDCASPTASASRLMGTFSG